ncbi:MAG: hypothetical protein AXA67_05055 [Methylothermaceae bacteria B42]|nr:MAG: hypothetical protein AXA67_05055 [Methylothermaceae bacteria B42]HHJ39887.1 outer membrane lipoprotein LolB [Methylothermaceae bacterium]
MIPSSRYLNASLIWIFLCLSVTSCAVWRAPVLEERRTKEWAWLQTIDAWQMEGRIGVSGGREHWHGHLLWKHNPTLDYMLVSGPLGQGGIAVWLTKGLVKIDRGKGDVRVSNQPGAFLKELFGVELPLQSMHFWVLGRPVPEVAHNAEYRPDGRLHQLHQGAWSVLYKRYVKVGEGSLPEKIIITGPGGIRLKLIVHDWQVNV